MADNKFTKEELKDIRACLKKIANMETRQRPTWEEYKRLFNELDLATSRLNNQ